MILPTITKVEPISLKAIKISWEFPVTLEDIGEYEFKLISSESPDEDNPGNLLHTFNHEKEYVFDCSVKKVWKDIYFRIIAFNKGTGEKACTDWVKMEDAPDLEALEIVRRNNILLTNRRHGIGLPIAVFKLKTVGPHCPDCWDFNKQKIRSSNCNSCYKTGIQGGYYAPILTWANLTPPVKQLQIPQWGEMEANEIRIFMNNWPSVNPKDLVYIPSKQSFYTVEQVETSCRRGFVLHQLVALSGCEKSSVVYKLLDEYPDKIKQLSEMRNRIKLK